MIIYKTTNNINGKFYVGKDCKNKKSYLGSGKILRQAIQKYGKENFKKEILEICSSLEELEIREKYWIAKLDAVNIGYNITEGGTGGDTHGDIPHPNWGFKPGSIPWNKGIKWTDEQKMRTSNIIKNLNLGPNKHSYKPGKEHIMYGKKQSESTIKNRVVTRKKNNSYKGVGVFAPKSVKNIEDGNIFKSIQEAADFYNITRDNVGYSCRKETKKGKFRFIN